MHFANKETIHGKAVRACSFVLAMLIMCSMMFVGQVGEVKASAAILTPDETIYVKIHQGWFADAVVGLHCWSPDTEYYLTDSETDNRITYVETTDDGYRIYSIKIDTGTSFDGFLIYRTPEKGSSYWNKTSNITSRTSGTNMIVVERPSSSGISTNWQRYGNNFKSGYELYIKANDSWKANSASVIIGYRSDDNKWYLIKAGVVNGENSERVFHVKFDKPFEVNQFSIYRFNPYPTGLTDNQVIMDMKENVSYPMNGKTNENFWNAKWNQAENVYIDDSHNCIKITGGNDSWQMDNYTRNTFAVSSNSSFSVSSNNYSNAGVSIFPVDAVFYDYLTDYEVDNGWRNNIYLDYAASRYYQTRIPFTKMNSYISSNYNNSNYNYLLYFGNFYSDAADKEKNSEYNPEALKYGSLIGYKLNEVPLLQNNTTNYTNGSTLNKFSIFANDSTPIKNINNISEQNVGIGNYSGSMQNLFSTELTAIGDNSKSGSLKMLGEGIAPYFSDDLVNAGYAKKVTTKFPFRVDKNQTIYSAYADASAEDRTSYNVYNADGTATSKYTIYEFNSGYVNGVTSDNVYFDWNNNGEPTKINYGQGSDYELTDANKALGGLAKNHRGFFPFDNKANGDTATAYDYGFGMRLDIPFNLSEDGYVTGVTYQDGSEYKKIPMRFEFEGDDDVVVYIDGKLALDLGGDHGNAKGYIDFSIDNPVAVVETGAMVLTNSPSTNSLEVLETRTARSQNTKMLNTATTSKGNTILPPDGTVTVDGNTKSIYDTEKEHTLTVFYMERGLCESNLHITMSFNPSANKLTTNNTVDIKGVNQSLLDDVAKIANDDSFDFTYVDGNVAADTVKTYEYTVNDGTSRTTLGDGVDISAQITNDGTVVTTQDGTTLTAENNQLENVVFKSQFTDGNNITVTETPNSDNKLKYNTKYDVYDNSVASDIPMNGYNKKSVTADGNDGRNVSFTFTTADTNINPKNDFTVKAYNEIQVAQVTLAKQFEALTGKTLTGNETAEFIVKIKLPGESSAKARKLSYTKGSDTTLLEMDSDGKISLKNNESITIPGIPVGSSVEIVESTQGYEATITGGTVSTLKSTVSVDNENATAVNFKNKEIEKEIQLKPYKYIGTAAVHEIPTADQTFSFKLIQVDADDQTVTNGVNQTKTNVLSEISFDSIKYGRDDIGKTYYYRIEEDGTGVTDYNIDSTKYYAVVNVEWANNDLSVTTTFHKDSIDGDVVSSLAEVAFYNTLKPQNGYLKVIKKNGTNASELNKVVGAEFSITPVTGDNSNDVDTTRNLTEDNSKLIVSLNGNDTEVSATTGEIPLGWYKVVETKAPTGFELSVTAQWIEVTANNTALANAAEVEFTNYESTNLPTTGGPGAVLLIIGGIVLVALGVFLLKPSKKEKTSPTDSK